MLDMICDLFYYFAILYWNNNKRLSAEFSYVVSECSLRIHVILIILTASSCVVMEFFFRQFLLDLHSSACDSDSFTGSSHVRMKFLLHIHSFDFKTNSRVILIHELMHVHFVAYSFIWTNSPVILIPELMHVHFSNYTTWHSTR